MSVLSPQVRQRDHKASDGRVRARLSNPVAGLEVDEPVEHHVRSRRIDRQHGQLQRVGVRCDLDDFVLRNNDFLRPGAVGVGGQHDHPLAQQALIGLRPGVHDDADALTAERRRRFGFGEIQPAYQQQVRRVHRGGLHAHEHIAGPGSRVAVVVQRHRFRGCPELCQKQVFHGQAPA